MNLKKFNSKKINEGSDLIVRDPVSSEKTDIVITLLSADSDIYRSRLNKMSDRMQRTLHKRKGRQLSSAELRGESIELYADCTAGWKNIELEKAPFEHNKENAVKLYTDYPWIFEQVEEFVEDRANFL